MTLATPTPTRRPFRPCGQAFEGRVTEAVPADTVFSRAALVMHVRECSADSVRVPFHVGADRSRTWVITRTAAGLRLGTARRFRVEFDLTRPVTPPPPPWGSTP